MSFSKHATRLLVSSMLLLIGLLINGCDRDGGGNYVIGDETPSPAILTGTIVVTTNSGAKEWTVGSYNNLTVTVGSKLVFNYGVNHDVILMGIGVDGANHGAFATGCSFYGNTELARNDHGCGGEKCCGDTAANQYNYTVTDYDLNAGTIRFSCSFSPKGSFSHCKAGQQLVVNVVRKER